MSTMNTSPDVSRKLDQVSVDLLLAVDSTAAAMGVHDEATTACSPDRVPIVFSVLLALAAQTISPAQAQDAIPRVRVPNLYVSRNTNTPTANSITLMPSTHPTLRRTIARRSDG